jgi:hypothetical protein
VQRNHRDGEVDFSAMKIRWTAFLLHPTEIHVEQKVLAA